MNDNRSIDFRTVVFVIFITAAFVALPALIYRERHKTHAKPIGYERADERAAALENVRTNGVATLESYGWRNKNEQIVRIPIDQAKKLTAQEWQDPATARKKLLSLAAKAFTPPPKAPEKKSEYE
jgi:hypothetical protein